MAKLRKMLGSVDNLYIISLMRVIETQSKATLGNWAVSCAEEKFLPIYETACPGEQRLREIIEKVQEYLKGTLKLKEVKPLLREASQIAKDAEGQPVAQAAARAVATACGTIQTPSNALGFVFYGAAAVAYSELGTEEKPEVYDTFASEVFQQILESLQQAAVPEEENPVKINWNC